MPTHLLPIDNRQGIDIQFLRHIQGRATIIPIIAKADTVLSAALASIDTLGRLRRARSRAGP